MSAPERPGTVRGGTAPGSNTTRPAPPHRFGAGRVVPIHTGRSDANAVSGGGPATAGHVGPLKHVRGTGPTPDPPGALQRFVQHVDRYYPGQQDPIGAPDGRRADQPQLVDGHWRMRPGQLHPEPSRLRYVLWFFPRPVLFPSERAPRIALHLIECRGPNDG
jgi:hypothetical protein